MKFNSKVSAFVCLLFAFEAFGGTGMGGGVFSKTMVQLQSFAYDRAVLTIEGSTNLPETELTPKLVIAPEEYADFVKEVEKQDSTGSEPLVLTVKDSAGVERYFVLQHVGSVTDEPLIMYLVEQ